ncbi:hypothetical protein [uncultured Nisaea sp.]|jgi:hypothetical protein|uniref:hypothetical protein n=1 Tax=uncultured Nisaea sp. TaxID=538215 RepID=UPI0030EE73CA|tara:strand:+ start:893 stop:1144 length:252 start_codon:yes stop_codon:yes gene_type:complete
MIDPNLIGELQKDHQKLLLTKDEAAAFLGDLAALCRQHHVLLRTSDGMIRFSKSFEKSDTRTTFKTLVDSAGRAPAAKIVMKD